jgi:hypothetical protein
MAEEADEELIHSGRATLPCGPGGALVAGALTLTRAAVTWRPDTPASAAARELDVARITGAFASERGGCSEHAACSIATNPGNAVLRRR